MKWRQFPASPLRNTGLPRSNFTADFFFFLRHYTEICPSLAYSIIFPQPPPRYSSSALSVCVLIKACFSMAKESFFSVCLIHDDRILRGVPLFSLIYSGNVEFRISCKANTTRFHSLYNSLFTSHFTMGRQIDFLYWHYRWVDRI